jgi:hypothetical protein
VTPTASPPAADLYVVKHILHDWNDEQCCTLLGNIARSAKPGARVLVIEMVIPEDGSPSVAPLMDLNMLVLLPGRERTAGQYGELFSASGLRGMSRYSSHDPYLDPASAFLKNRFGTDGAKPIPSRSKSRRLGPPPRTRRKAARGSRRGTSRPRR